MRVPYEIWTGRLRVQRAREQAQAKLRALLLQAHPTAVTVWASMDHGIQRAEARAVLAAAPTAATAQRITMYRLSKILADAGRKRLVDPEAYRLRDAFAVPVLRLPAAVEQAMAVEMVAATPLTEGIGGSAEVSPSATSSRSPA